MQVLTLHSLPRSQIRSLPVSFTTFISFASEWSREVIHPKIPCKNSSSFDLLAYYGRNSVKIIAKVIGLSLNMRLLPRLLFATRASVSSPLTFQTFSWNMLAGEESAQWTLFCSTQKNIFRQSRWRRERALKTSTLRQTDCVRRMTAFLATRHVDYYISSILNQCKFRKEVGTQLSHVNPHYQYQSRPRRVATQILR